MCETKSGFELRLRPMTLPAARQHPLPVTEIVGGKLHGMPPRDTEAIPTPRTSERSHALSLLRPNVRGWKRIYVPEARACRRGDRMMGRSSLAAGADRHLSGGAVRWFDARPLRPARSDCAKHMDDTAERHHTEECQRT